MEILDYTPVPKRFRFMTGQTWKLTFKINDVTGAVNLNNSDITAIITSPQGSKTYLTKSDGISVSTDGKFFVLKKDWTSLTTDQNDNVMMNPSLQILPKGTLTLQVFITDETGTDTTPIFMYIDVVDIPSDSSEYRMNANTTIEVTLNDGVLIGVGVQPISDRIEWRRVGFRIDVRYIGESTWTEWANFSSINKGDTGLSAYELAVSQGFVGTVSEWLTSLKVKDGRFIGLYNATTNTPTLSAAPAQGVLDGDFYRIAVGGTIPFAGQNFTANTVCYEGDMIGKIGNQWFLLKYGYGQMMQRVTEAATSATQAAASATTATQKAAEAAQKAVDAATQAAQALASSTSATAVAQGNATARPTKKPGIFWDFANSKMLDPRLVFQRSTIGSHFDRNGNLQIISNGQPRFQHDPLTGECLGLLFENTRKNIILYSENFSQNPWTSDSLSFSNGSLFWGKYQSTRIQEIANLTVDARLMYGVVTVEVGKRYTFSLFARYNQGAEDRYLQANFNTGFANSPGAIFDLKNGTIVTSTNVDNVKIRKMKNGIFRISYSTLDTNITTASLRVRPTPYSNPNNIGTPQSYATTSTASSFDIFGAQLEEGVSESSYMPTSGVVFTRSADRLGLSGALFQEIFPYADYTKDGCSIFMSARRSKKRVDNYYPYFRFLSSAGNYFSVSDGASGIVYPEVWKDGVQKFNSQSVYLQEDDLFKFVLALKPDDTGFFFNGTKIGNDIDVEMPSGISSFWIGDGISTIIRQFAFWPERLTDTEANALTANSLGGKENNQLPANSDLGTAAYMPYQALLRAKSRQEFSIDCTGASQTRNIRRPYDFTFETVDSSGITITNQPSGTCTANTDYPLVINGAVGKTFSYAIIPIFEY